MSIIKVCNYYISTNYKKTEAKEKFEESLSSFIEDLDKDTSFDLVIFIESLTEDGEDFEMLSEIDEDEAEIEYSDEDMDTLVEKMLSVYVDEDDFETAEIDEETEE